jgi:hypothetical protein
MRDEEYVRQRVALIPEAERISNRLPHGRSNAMWDITFHRTMKRLVDERIFGKKEKP